MSILAVENLTAGYNRVPIIQDVCIQADPGQVVTLIGPNGAGKSTLLKAIFGVLRPTAGRVTVADRDITGLPPHLVARQGMAYVPQVNNVFPSLTVIENLEMGAFVQSGDVRPRIEAVLSVFPDLRAAARRRAGTLSGGQRNMLAMARSLMLDPKVVLLDEPTAGLSPGYTRVVWEQIRRIAALGTAVVVVEQNVHMALEHADWGYVLVAGRNRLAASPAELLRMDLAAVFLGAAEEVVAGQRRVEH